MCYHMGKVIRFPLLFGFKVKNVFYLFAYAWIKTGWIKIFQKFPLSPFYDPTHLVFSKPFHFKYFFLSLHFGEVLALSPKTPWYILIKYQEMSNKKNIIQCQRINLLITTTLLCSRFRGVLNSFKCCVHYIPASLFLKSKRKLLRN